MTMNRVLVIIFIAGSACSCGFASSDGGQVIDSEAYFFISEYEGMVGGVPARVRTTYVSESGLVQESRETSDHEILTFKEGKVGTGGFFSELQECIPLPPVVKELGGQDVPLPEYYPPSVNAVFSLREKSPDTQMWSGKADMVPTCLRKAISAAHEVLARDKMNAKPIATVYIRAHLLHEAVAKAYQKAGLFKKVSTEDMDGNVYLQKALKNPFRLILVEGKDNPFVPFYKSFVPGRDNLKLSTKKGYFQVFSFVEVIDAKPSSNRRLRGT